MTESFKYDYVILRNMELVSRVSKGSRMDQVYIPKRRNGFGIGTYVVLKPLETRKPVEKPYLYNIEIIEPIKIELAKEMISTIDNLVHDYENIIITGSFLDKGFNFNDIDVMVISESKLDENYIKKHIEEKLKIRIHLILLNNKTLMEGLSTDPLYQLMLSRCIAKKRFIYKAEHKIDYRILDLHLLKSKLLIDNFDFLDGNEKYYLIRNMIAIDLFLDKGKMDKERMDKEIKKIFNLKNVDEIKRNVLNKDMFLRRYEKVYKNIFNKIMRRIKYGSKQKKID